MDAKCDRIGDTFGHPRCIVPLIADCPMSLLGAASGASVLDVDGGTGNYTSALAERGLTVVGTEVSRIMLTKARTERPPGTRLRTVLVLTAWPSQSRENYGS